MRNRYLIILAMATLVILLDQISKAWVLQTIPAYTEIPVIQGLFSLVHVRNRGAAFGFLNRSDISWQFWFFFAATILAIFVILMLARSAQANERFFFTALGWISGGAVGNLIDRIRFREVVDFLDFYYGHWHWPAFNIADIAICCGAVLALILSWRRTDSQGGK